MAEQITSTEMENALTAIFEKIDVVETTMNEMDTRVDGIESLARSAMAAATSAKKDIVNIHTVPTNGHDVFLGILSKGVKLAAVGILCWTVVKCVQAYNQPYVNYYGDDKKKEEK